MSLRSQIDLALQRIGVEMKARTPKILRTTANVTNSNATATAVGTLSFTAVAGKSYHVQIIGNYQSGNTANGARFGLTGTAVITNVAGNMKGGVASTAAATELVIPIASTAALLITTGVSVTNTPHHFQADYVFTCSTGGTHQLTFGSEVNGQTSTLLAGASMIYQEFA